MEIYDHNTLHTQSTSTPPQKRDVLKIVLAVLCAVLAALLAVVSICFVFARKENTQTQDYERTFARVRPSVAQVRAMTLSGVMSGSGVVYKIRGGATYVITNHHVIENALRVDLTFTDYDTPQVGEVLGYDEYHDIALVKVEGAFGAPVTAAEAPAVGTRVLAVGNNLGLGIAAFDGIVSHNDRALEVKASAKTVPVYAVTSPINGGMSGGGVFTASGKIIGIGTYQTVSVGESPNQRPVDGMSYCVPFGIAGKIADRILREESEGQVNRLHVYFDTRIDDDICFEELFFSVRRLPKGYTVDGDVFLASSMTAELKDGDILERFGSLTVTAQTPFRAFFEEALSYSQSDAYADGARLTVSVLRGSAHITVEFKNVHKAA